MLKNCTLGILSLVVMLLNLIRFTGAAQDLRVQPKTFREAMPVDESLERNGRRKIGAARTLLQKLLRESINKPSVR